MVILSLVRPEEHVVKTVANRLGVDVCLVVVVGGIGAASRGMGRRGRRRVPVEVLSIGDRLDAAGDLTVFAIERCHL